MKFLKDIPELFTEYLEEGHEFSTTLQRIHVFTPAKNNPQLFKNIGDDAYYVIFTDNNGCLQKYRWEHLIWFEKTRQPDIIVSGVRGVCSPSLRMWSFGPVHIEFNVIKQAHQALSKGQPDSFGCDELQSVGVTSIRIGNVDFTYDVLDKMKKHQESC